MKTKGHGDDFKLMGVSGEDPTDVSEADPNVDAGDDNMTVSLEDGCPSPSRGSSKDPAPHTPESRPPPSRAPSPPRGSEPPRSPTATPEYQARP
ncbi:hypothetical protein SRHO_G00216010 [Serrasalmus rhombeus]